MVLINRQIMNDYERFRQCSPLDSSLAHHYPWTDRSMSMAVSHAMRSDLRNCPTRQTRNLGPSDPDPESNGSHPRRRIAVAVGSYVPRPNVYTYPNQISSTALSMNNMYHGQSSDYSYAPHPKSVVPARAYSHYGPVGYSDDSSADSYAYQPLQVTGNDMLTTGYIGGAQEPMRSWSAMGQKQPASNAIYLDEPSTASYSNLQLPYLSTTPVTRQPTLAADNMSAFSMNSLQSSLASPPPPPHLPLPPSIEDRHLPVPTATRMQMTPSSALHLRTQQTSLASASNALSYSKSSAIAWNPDSAVQENRRPTPSVIPNGLPSGLSHGQLMSTPVIKAPASSSLQDSVFSGIHPEYSFRGHSFLAFTGREVCEFWGQRSPADIFGPRGRSSKE
ncbi:hypothetical protein SLS58_002553 [Diplodia intermedia]|uniref:Uncharacterized protein n=1 Tax=Diplodia intermedia TaxID=856260 RepID=A0ABR3TZ31_9PEZI